MSPSLLLRTFVFIVIATLVPTFAQAAVITNYRATYIPGFDVEERLVIAIRMFERDEQRCFLVVDSQSLQTRILPAGQLALRRPFVRPGESRYMMALDIERSAYGQARHYAQHRPVSIQNAGLIHAAHAVNGIFLTVDMCPSSRLFEATFFQALVERSRKTKEPVDVAICISGLWAISHTQEMDWLVAQQKQQTLRITWVNHSLSHLYFHDLELQENFLLSPFTHFEHEVLATEEILLAHDQLPSIFFRYPGLVADETTMEQLTQLGLLPLGADAWLAKGQTPTDGSIVLVHGNSNEPAGIAAAMPLVTAPDAPALLPLAQAVLGPS